jgi:FkbM family methyltransferase
MTERSHAVPRAAAAGLDFTTAIQQIYRALLGRDADPEGLEHWGSVALQANSLEPVLTGIITSEECRFKQEQHRASYLHDLAPFSAYPDSAPRAAAPSLDFATAVQQIYRALLGRDAEPKGLEYWSSVTAQANSLDAVLVGVIASEEYRSKQEHRGASHVYDPALFNGYSEADLTILEAFKNPNIRAEAGFVVDFLGGRTRVTSLWNDARKLDGQVLGLPVPADYHAEAAEWVGLLKSVQSARDRWVGMELGAGLGPWLVAGGNAARLRGITDIRLCAVEADPQHFRLMKQHLIDNGFAPDAHRLVQAAVGAKAGTALWPALEDSRDDWGSRPIPINAPGELATDYLGRALSTVPVEIVSMADLIDAEPRWNMVHIDVQGHEVEICSSCIEKLNDRVQWLIVGTHSRKLDGDMLELLYSAGWVLENEKPAKFNFSRAASSLEAMTAYDGIQVWRNPRLDRVDPEGNTVK